jgi:hypothetical protein
MLGKCDYTDHTDNSGQSGPDPDKMIKTDQTGPDPDKHDQTDEFAVLSAVQCSAVQPVPSLGGNDPCWSKGTPWREVTPGPHPSGPSPGPPPPGPPPPVPPPPGPPASHAMSGSILPSPVPPPQALTEPDSRRIRRDIGG